MTTRTQSPSMLPDPSDETSLLDQVMEGFVLLDEAIIRLADADAVLGIGQLIAHRAGLPVDRAVRALDAASEEPLSVLCRASGVNVDGFSALLRLRRRRLGGDRNPSSALQAFRDMPVATAQRVIALLRAFEATEQGH